MSKKYAVLADCKKEEVASFLQGLNEATPWPFRTESSISNGTHKTKLQNLRRYAAYFTTPLHVFCQRSQYTVIIGWQQFYALNFAFYCRLFGVRKAQNVVVTNFTYKHKGGGDRTVL